MNVQDEQRALASLTGIAAGVQSIGAAVGQLVTNAIHERRAIVEQVSTLYTDLAEANAEIDRLRVSTGNPDLLALLVRADELFVRPLADSGQRLRWRGDIEQWRADASIARQQ